MDDVLSTYLTNGETTAESMRKAIENSVIQYDDNEIRLTTSFGIYNVKLSGTESVDELLKHADEKQYTAKRNGRNRVEY